MISGAHILILGAGGQVGRNVAALYRLQGTPVRALTRAECDITDPVSIQKAIEGSGFVINCAAYTAVDKAESEPELAHAINAVGPGLLAEACNRHGIPLLHISTDYVFGDPIGRPWREDDPIAPQNHYGRTKAAGEEAVRAACPAHLIVRTAWVYDSEGKNFVLTMLKLGAERDRLSVVGDQRGGPTSAEDIAHAFARMVTHAGEKGFTGWGTYHFSGAPETTWYDFAAAIFAGNDKPELVRIATADYPTPAKRPLYSVLDCAKLKQTFGVAQPDWKNSLNKVLKVAKSR